MSDSRDHSWMERALSLAAQGQGCVEPNPMVGCVIISDDGHEIGSGFHERYGQAHAERNALADARQRGNGDKLSRATVYVTLEPCCHTGKTPPCTDALIESGVKRVVVAMLDPFAMVSGKGARLLTEAGITVEHGVLESEARRLNLPYLKRIREEEPWVIAKWAMSLDGKVATRSRNSQWISCEESRRRVHELRGRMDAIMVGIGTALADDPMLNTRPAELAKRPVLRVVMDSQLRVAQDSRLVQSARQYATLIVAAVPSDESDLEKFEVRRRNLEEAGVEIWTTEAVGSNARIRETLHFLASEKSVTNLLLEGGSQLLGAFADCGALDECHVYIAPKLIGGAEALSPVGGRGFDPVSSSTEFDLKSSEILGTDAFLQYVSHSSLAACGLEDPN